MNNSLISLISVQLADFIFYHSYAYQLAVVALYDCFCFVSLPGQAPLAYFHIEDRAHLLVLLLELTPKNLTPALFLVQNKTHNSPHNSNGSLS